MYEKLLVPLIFGILYLFYIWCSLQVVYQKKRELLLETAIPTRSYRAFEFFFTITIALVAGIGYLKINVVENNAFTPVQALWANKMITVLSVFQWVSCSFLIVAVTAHLGSKWERWKTIMLKECWRWVEPWMMIFAYITSEAIWVITRSWYI